MFTLFAQAHALEWVPRLRGWHTNPDQRGQVYIPEVNRVLMCGCVVVCAVFQSDAALASAYGITVTGTFVITTLLLCVVLRRVLHWGLWPVVLLATPMLGIDLLFLSSNMAKLFPLGWLPLLI